MKPTDAQIEFNKILSNNNKNASVKICIWKHSESKDCSGKIIDAHSIQRGKILSAIADLGDVYHLGLKPNEDLLEMETVFEKQGIKKFSTFKGFCQHHDKKIFQPIEDKSFIASDKQMHIYAYRAASKELHANLESSELCKNLLGDKVDDLYPAHFEMHLPLILKGIMEVPPYIKEMMIEEERLHQVRTRFKQTNLNCLELRKICDHIEKVIEDEEEPLFEHLYYSFENEYPLACSTCFIPYFDFNGNKIISPNEIKHLSSNAVEKTEDCKNVFLNIFPEEGKTHVIFTYFKKNTKLKESIIKLLNLKNPELKISLSTFILNYAENVAFNPNYIDKNFDDKKMDHIKKAFKTNIFDRGAFTKNQISLFVD